MSTHITSRDLSLSNHLITRFSPSPTGLLHVGNIRTALYNYLHTLRHGGKFYLRIDDTDLERSKEEYTQQIKSDLNWLGIKWDAEFQQSKRTEIYRKILQELEIQGKVYQCFETAEELALQRRLQSAGKMPPVYDRNALKITKEEREKKLASGLKPHYRFLLEDKNVLWDDKIKGELNFNGRHFSDPVLMREDGSFTYVFCSVVDDVEMSINFIMRGEDHITNTAIQIQLFHAIIEVFQSQREQKLSLPEFAHVPLVQLKDGVISKRFGGHDVKYMREIGIMPLSIVNYLCGLGYSTPFGLYHNLQDASGGLDIKKISKSDVNYSTDDLLKINQKFLASCDVYIINKALQELMLQTQDISPEFWDIIKNNVNYLTEVANWWAICQNFSLAPHLLPVDKNEVASFKMILKYAGDILDKSPDFQWTSFLDQLKMQTAKNGSELFKPLRIAITGQQNGPELAKLIPFIGLNEVKNRLHSCLNMLS